jgi:hypothetical protein
VGSRAFVGQGGGPSELLTGCVEATEQVSRSLSPVLNQTLNGQVVDRPPAAPCRAGLGRGDGRRPIVGSDELFEEARAYGVSTRW